MYTLRTAASAGSNACHSQANSSAAHVQTMLMSNISGLVTGAYNSSIAAAPQI
jgi:hypothetical protein